MSKSKASAAPEPVDDQRQQPVARLVAPSARHSRRCGHRGLAVGLERDRLRRQGRGVQKIRPCAKPLDQLLKRKGRLKVEDVAFTIFPQRLWEMSRGDRTRLFTLYRATFPRWQAMNKKANGRGLYFERMVMYGRGPCDGNQLEWILSQFNSRAGVRRSMLQATTFDPGRDHVASAQLGFPCLQQVSFEPTAAGLVVNAFYATQQIFDKAYGNYLGLAQLGAFMAHEMGMPLARLNVMVGVAKLERITKSDADFAPLVAAAQALVSGPVGAPARAAVSVTAIGAAS